MVRQPLKRMCRVLLWRYPVLSGPGFSRQFSGMLVLSVLILAGCSENATGPVEVNWDRDSCERCRMVLSDRKHAAQVRGGPATERAKVYKFDDIGGAVVWLEDKAWRDDPATELWVTDHRDGRWIDGRKAIYLSGQMTPMDFGFGAQDAPSTEGMSYQQARARILDNEARRQAQSGHHSH